MAVILEAYKLQHRKTILHTKKALFFKLVLLIVTALSFIFMNNLIYITIIVFSISMFMYIKEFKIIGESLLIYLPPTMLIILIDYLAGTLTPKIISLLLFGYTSFLVILLFYATTPIQQIYDVFGRNIITLALLMLHNIVAELNEVIESKRIRGWEPGWNILNHFLIVFEGIRLMVLRINTIVDALRARGVD